MKLVDLHQDIGLYWLPLQLLNEREPHQNISHRTLPHFDDHVAFIERRPYEAWYWFAEPKMDRPAGCVYLTHQREIGVGVLRQFRGQGLAKQAIAELMRLHPGRFLANVAPGNAPSHSLFEGLGFKPLQVTYVLE